MVLNRWFLNSQEGIRYIIMEKEIIDLIVDNSFVDSNGKAIQADDDLIEIGLNSLNCIQLIVLLEDKYNIEFGYSDLSVESVNTVSKIINYILSHKN